MKVRRRFKTQQPHGPDLAVRGGLDALGQLYRTAAPGKGFEKLVIRSDSRLSLNGLDIGNTVSEVHIPKLYQIKVYATQISSIPGKGTLAHPLEMGDWVGRDKFRADVDEYLESTGKVQEEVAKSLGVVLTYFRQVLYGSKKPSTKLLRKAASLFGTELISYLVDPGAKIVGQDVKGLSPKEQVWADMLFTKFKDPSLDEYDRQMIFEDWTKDYDRIKAQKLRSQRH